MTPLKPEMIWKKWHHFWSRNSWRKSWSSQVDQISQLNLKMKSFYYETELRFFREKTNRLGRLDKHRLIRLVLNPRRWMFNLERTSLNHYHRGLEKLRVESWLSKVNKALLSIFCPYFILLSRVEFSPKLAIIPSNLGEKLPTLALPFCKTYHHRATMN